MKKLPKGVRARLVPLMLALREQLRPSGCRKIQGAERDYRIRMRDYRVVYEILNEELRVNILAVGHRKEIYRFYRR